MELGGRFRESNEHQLKFDAQSFLMWKLTGRKLDNCEAVVASDADVKLLSL